MKKHFILISLLACMMYTYAQKVQVNGVNYTILPDGTAEVSSLSYSSDNVIILPSVSYNGDVYKVTAIGKGAFFGSAIKTVNIPNRIRIIKSSAFSKCNELQSITIPEGVEIIEGYAFRQNDNLESVTLPSTLKVIGESAFGYCHKLYDVILPEGLKVIGDKAFFDCWNLKSINLPETVDSIGNAAFMATGIEVPVYNARIFAHLPKGYSGTYVVPEGIKIIAPSAFAMAEYVKVVELPESLEKIGMRAFGRHNNDFYSDRFANSHGDMGGCRSLSKIKIPDGVSEIGSAAFIECENLSEVSLPLSLGIIEGYTFCKCKSLKSVEIRNQVTIIGNAAFGNCTNLVNVRMTDGITEIGYGAFENCAQIIGLQVPGTVTKIGGNAFKGLPYIMYSGSASGAPWGAGAVCQ